mmetsp:Transcript_40540/g.114825  ORF Transcript_40540/g.114825 Transcript_40540/m.114825 type:complete len:276 (+) Transcript_40540:369-1196(+)|eukprot:CAMPEP_0117682824 /NCGR_PEP_ID=MMETSP0804-20121206/19942_1 /TAXON_ID=1074897 /ORGANISM="Tetraselmis astigmatica, Strain CCMP880" /LENGTH=275 /DNA_ID=CAMNT_0005493115 /DNA_START=309 /DNA_END=1136 /DNA_ORIENTATION=+
MVTVQLQNRLSLMHELLNSRGIAFPATLGMKTMEPGGAGGVMYLANLPMSDIVTPPLLDEKDTSTLEFFEDNVDPTAAFLLPAPAADPQQLDPLFASGFGSNALNNSGVQQWSNSYYRSAPISSSLLPPIAAGITAAGPTPETSGATSGHAACHRAKAESDSSAEDDDTSCCHGRRKRSSSCLDDDLDDCAKGNDVKQESWFLTLKSAGVRIKGRTKDELMEVADRIRKRRRESAARSRARKANRVCNLSEENATLKQENDKLKRQIAELELKFL